MKFTEKELYQFVRRANTPSKMVTAEKWLKKNVTDNDLFDDLMVALTLQYRNYFRAKEGRELI